jgi:hypothetical protein
VPFLEQKPETTLFLHTGVDETIEKKVGTGRDNRDRDSTENFGTGQTGFGTTRNISGQDKRDSEHGEVCPKGL